jgi:hypothetical protein
LTTGIDSIWDTWRETYRENKKVQQHRHISLKKKRQLQSETGGG